jgi:4-hydroxybenzoate polyprenyltransferase
MYAMRWFIIYPIYSEANETEFQFAEWKFALSVLVMVLLAAAGNIINDYFDVRVDRLNKPDKVIVGRLVKRRVAMAAHHMFNGLAVLIALYLAWDLGTWLVVMVPVFMAVSLWYYSLLFKKQFFIGNFVVALMVGIVPLWAGFFELGWSIFNPEEMLVSPVVLTVAWKWILGYAAFAFMLTLIREAQKDLEDKDGDKAVGFSTMAVVWKKSGTRAYIVVLSTITLVVICGVIWKLFGGADNGIVPLMGSAVLVVFPMIAGIITTSNARNKAAYKRASSLSKLAMAGGIACSLLVAGMYLDWY